ASTIVADAATAYWLRAPASDTGGEIVRSDGLVLVADQREMFTVLPGQLAVDDTNVYRSEFSPILAVPKAGGTQIEVARGDVGPFLAVDGPSLYWATVAKLHRQRKGTTTDELLAASPRTLIDPLAVTDAAVFWWGNGLERIDATTLARSSVDAPRPDDRVFV